MEDTISLTEILKAIKKRWKLILLITLSAGLIASFISLYILKPVYQASTQILVNQKNAESQLDFGLIRSNIDLINTYSVIIKSPIILEKVIQKLDMTESVEELNKNISISSQNNSQVFTLAVEADNAKKAAEIANTVSETFQIEIKSIMNVDNVNILSKAELKENPNPIKPVPFLNITIAVVLGLMISIGLAILLDFLDGTLKDDQDVVKHLQVPVLGSIQEFPNTRMKGRSDALTQKKVGSETIVS